MIHRSADRTQIANQILAALIAMIDFAIQFEDKQTCQGPLQLRQVDEIPNQERQVPQ